MPRCPSPLLCAALLYLVLATPGRAAGVELWEGESTSVTTATAIVKGQIVRGSVTAESEQKGVATASKPTGDNGTFTITGVKEGKTTIKVTGKRVVYATGTGGRAVRNEVSFTSFIQVTVTRPEEEIKILILKRKEQRTINFPKHLRMIQSTLRNSNKQVCFARANTQSKLTIIGKQPGESKITVQLWRKKKGKKKRIRGIIYVEVIDEVIDWKKKRTRIAWIDMFIGRIVILDDGQPAVRKGEDLERVREGEKKEDDPEAEDLEEDAESEDSSYVLPGTGAEYVSLEGVRNDPCTLDPGNDPVLVRDPIPVPIAADEEPTDGPCWPPGMLPFAPPPPEEEPEEPTTPPAWTAAVKAAAQVVQGVQLASVALAGASIKLNLGEDPEVVRGPDEGYDQDPISGVTDENGVCQLSLTAEEVEAYGLEDLAEQVPAFVETLDLTPRGGKLVHMSSPPAQALHPGLQGYLRTVIPLRGSSVAVLSYPRHQEPQVQEWLQQSRDVEHVEEDYCRGKEDPPGDPLYATGGSWQQNYDDQWALKRVGCTPGAGSPWEAVQGKAPVTVAVIDTGLDWNHRDLSWENIWTNRDEVAGNGLDDDGNGYVDDIIGWNFVQSNHKPWDRDGHGTHIAGVIAATSNNGVGIAGMNPNSRIMPLKALNNFGQTRASYVAEAILYAADNGARVINLSVGGAHRTRTEQEAIDHAHARGAVVVVAAGNKGIDMQDYGLAAMERVITVAATDVEDQRPSFSNWGAGIDIAAPGVDVLSLRARRTDLMRDIPGVQYESRDAYVGQDRRYYRAAGTSFAAPFVSGAASLLLSRNPQLTPEQVTRMLLQSARDLDQAGVDQHTGYGLLDVRAAMAADPAFQVTAHITGVQVVRRDSGVFVQVSGTADANAFARATIQIGAGEQPGQWKTVGSTLTRPVHGNVLGEIPAGELSGSSLWIIRLVVQHQNGRTREMRFRLNLD